MQSIKRGLYTLLVLLPALMASACGWHLRGGEVLDERLKLLHLEVPGDQPELHRSLQRSFKSMGVQLADQASDAPLRLKLTRVSDKRRTISTSGRGKAAEYELTSIITYIITDRSGKILQGPSQVSAEKVYLFDPNNVVSAYEEEQILRKEMQRDLVQKIMRRYQALRPGEYSEATESE